MFCHHRTVLAAAMAVAALLAAAPAQAALSETLIDRIEEAHNAETRREYDRAIELYQRALGERAADPAWARGILKQRGLLYERIGRLDKAEEDLTAALSIKPVDPMLYADRGHFYIRSGRGADALQDFMAGAKLDPQNPLFPYGQGRALANLRSYRAAIDRYGEAIRLSPRDGRLYLFRAEAAVRLTQYDKALVDYDQALALGLKRRSERFFALVGRAFSVLVLGDYDEAVVAFDRVLDLEPRHTDSLLWRGYAQERRGERELALQDYERALSANPQDSWVRASVRRLRSGD